MEPHVYVIRVCGVSFYIDGPTKELLFQWPPNHQIGPRIKPYHVEGSLRQLGYRPRGISFSGIRIWALDMDAVREKRAAQAKGADPEDLAAAGVMLMGRKGAHD